MGSRGVTRPQLQSVPGTRFTSDVVGLGAWDAVRGSANAAVLLLYIRVWTQRVELITVRHTRRLVRPRDFDLHRDVVQSGMPSPNTKAKDPEP